MKYTVDTSMQVTIEVHNPDALERVTGAGGDEWRSQFYRLRTVEDVLEHWTYNRLVNGIEDISRLDGWADLPAAAVQIEVEHGELVITEAA